MALMTKQRLLIGGFALSVVINLGMVIYLANSGGLRRIFMKLDLLEAPKERAVFQVKDEARFRMLPNTPAEVVFAGDSLVADGPWSEFYSEIHNRGIGGDRTDGILRRLDEILESHPRKVVFEVGSNDLSVAVPVVQILRNYRTILTRVHAESPATRVIVLGVLPVNSTFPDAPVYSNEQVQAVNKPLRELVKEFPFAQFVDLADELVDDKKELKPEYTKDGIHMNIKGYLAIQGKVRSLLDQP